MYAKIFLDSLKENAAEDAMVWNGRAVSYRELYVLTTNWIRRFTEMQLEPSTVVAIEADFSPMSISAIIALIEKQCIIVPLARGNPKNPEYMRLAQVECLISIDESESAKVEMKMSEGLDTILTYLKSLERPGLVLFSSGSTGSSKAIVHDLAPLLEKYFVKRQKRRMIGFLLFDHFGGINTMLFSITNGGCLVHLKDRTPDHVLAAVEKFKVEILPTSPTFIRMMLLSEAYKRYDLSSLIAITYGTEVMPESTLKRLNELFPSLSIQQTYGASEVGVLRAKSKSSDSLWVKLGGEGVETRVVDGLLEIKSKSSMLGYLNAPSPFTEDGWYKTGDMVEVDGEYFRILGRKSEIINVGGEKVFPVEIENVILEMEGVEEVIVRGESNPLIGNMIAATIKLSTKETPDEFRRRLWSHCKDRLADYKIPQRVTFTEANLHSDRFKKNRAA